MKTTQPQSLDNRIVSITPEMAARWLENKASNRKIDSPTVLSMARDMAAGLWQITHQGIALDEKGVLIDGQHRLSAIIIANVEIKMMVTEGIPRATQLVIDDHRKRSGADVLTISTGNTVPSLIVAILQLMEWNQTKGGRKPTKSELSDAFARHGDAASFVFDEIKAHVRGVTIAPVLAPAARAWYEHDRSRLSQFIRVLSSGIPQTTPDDVAALRLRDWLISHREAKRRPTRGEIFDKSQVALSHFLERHAVKILRPSGRDLFPVPELMKNGSKKLRAVR